MAFPVNIADSMIDRVFHNRLQDHAGNTHIFHITFHLFGKMDISCKTHIQYVNIIVYCFQLFLQCSIFLTLLYIITEKICHLFHKNTGFFRILPHGELCSCIQGIKKKMRVDLGLEIFQLCFLQMCLHQKFPFHHLLLFFHTCLCPCDVKAEILHHGIKSPCHHPQFIFGIGWRHLHIKVSLTYQLCGFRHVCQRPEHPSCSHDQKDHSADYPQKHDHRIADLQIFHNCPESPVGLGIFFKKLLVQFIHGALDIAVKFQALVVFQLVLFHISASLGSYGSCCAGQIGFGHFPDLFLQKFYRILYILIIELFQFLPVFGFVLVIIHQCLGTFYLQILIHAVLYILKNLPQFCDLGIAGVYIIHLLHGIVDPDIKQHVDRKHQRRKDAYLDHDLADKRKVTPPKLFHLCLPPFSFFPPLPGQEN